MTTRHPWAAVEAILDASLELPPEQRDAYLDQACGGDESLRRELRELLASSDRSAWFIDAGALAFGALLVDPDPGRNQGIADGQRVGPYRIDRELARGGMGRVYLAHRDDGQFEQRIALKLIKQGMDSAEILRRFLAERQILARLNHLHIARLLDGGVTPEGQPWFAMELVEGESIVDYCNRGGLGVDGRLALFEHVCAAVHYAHQNLIVHRDLKPSNILVTVDGVVKLLDFGIAKLIDPVQSDTTQTAAWAMTPEYAAPEQVRMDPATTATDVYALGAVLYELLTRRRVHHFVRHTPSEIERVVCEVDPAPPGISPDLDTIILKALQKDPARRYATADALKEDLQRYRAGLPVRARPDTAGYRTRKFLRRHRLGVAATAVIGLSLVGGLTGVAWQAGVARREAAKAREVKEFLVDIFQVSDPAQSRGREVTARELLDRGAERLDTALTGEPEVKAELFDVLAGIHVGLGHFPRADTLYRRAVALSGDGGGQTGDELAGRLTRWSMALSLQSQYQQAESVAVLALDLRRRRQGPNHPSVGSTLNQLANLKRLKAEYDAGDSLYRQALEISRRSDKTDSLTTASYASGLGLLLWEAGRLAAADSAYQVALRIQRAGYDSGHPVLLGTLRNLALLRFTEGRLVEAETLQRGVVAQRRVLHPGGHPDLATALHDLATTLEQTGAWPEAESLHVEALALRRAWLGENAPQTINTINNLAGVRYRMGDLLGAEKAYRLVVQEWGKSLGPEHPHTLLATNNLGVMLRERGLYGEAEPVLRRALDGRRKQLGEDHEHVGQALGNYGVLLHRMGRLADAESHLLQAVAVYRKTLPETHLRIAVVLNALGSVLTDRGRPDEALPMLEQALQTRSKLDSSDVRLAETRRVMGVCLARLGRRDEAETMLLASFRTLENHPYGARLLRQTLTALVAFYRSEHRNQEAARYERMIVE